VNAAAIETACGAQVTGVSVKCQNATGSAGQTQTQRCVTVVHRTFGRPLETHK
jgi:hypothetical protein